ncbi:uncharacterized protein LOC121258722 [Juglans microcarpa x Juglans regia]|uniref:uncharacterized protein LOC121258722 n=1 Tax=Juglans microcarpa x Juglans regia TaxID=2249226 RepID=UPI001B7E6E16|nr:uncharacterized protein LOC121258722 [Juglans microcarpa x Juglans regia]
MARDKAPGSDGFSMAFFQECWEVVKGDVMSVFHETNGYDTLLFCDTDPGHIQSKALLICFEVVSSLKVNIGKSEMVLLGDVRNIRRLASILGSKVASLPMKYLGLPLGASFKANTIWDGVVGKIEEIFRAFLWVGIGEETKFPLVKRNKVFTPISNGRLGIHNQRIFNKALIGKWLWRYHHEGESYWKKIIELKDGSL